jgi:hypothetical protein
MIYTYGNIETYTQYLSECKSNGTVAKKLGISVDAMPDGSKYGGGIAYKTVEEALDGCKEAPEPYGVYALSGDWDADVYFDKEGGINRLKNSLEILYRVGN